MKLVVITKGELTASEPVQASGYNTKGNRIEVTGDVVEIICTQGDKDIFGLNITETGDLIVTDYAGLGWQTHIEQNFRFRTKREWKKEG